jgi:lipopolysaccharide/colanic/teichoic acid biosynthesis glycosyltransferase
MAAKRLMDLLAALTGLAVTGLVVPFVALANAFWAPGPLFYRQERVGLGGKPFSLLKFRSMQPDAEAATGAVWCGDRDGRITAVGHWLRKTRLDELPQALNILRGEMSLVGPRPERPEFVGELARQMPIYRVRHVAKPGITGWAQIRYRYGNSVEDARLKLEYDLYYIMHRSLYLDLLIAFQTIPVVLGLKGR